MTFAGFRTVCAVQDCGLVWWVSLLFPWLSWALHYGGSPVTSHGPLKWAATSHIKSTPWKALVLLQILLSPTTLFLLLSFMSFAQDDSGWSSSGCQRLPEGAWLTGRHTVFVGVGREACWITPEYRATFGSQWAVWKCLKTTHSSERKGRDLHSVVCLLHTHIAGSRRFCWPMCLLVWIISIRHTLVTKFDPLERTADP